MTSVKQEKGRLKIASVAVPEICWHLDAFSKKVSMYRNVQLNDVNRTVWCSFLALKEKGNSRLGLSFEKGNSEKLFVAVKQTQEPQLVVVRIDFSKKADKAYVFIVLPQLLFLIWKMPSILYRVNLILTALES